MKRLSGLYLFGLLVSVPFTNASAAVDDIVKKCASCHGVDGNSKHEQVPNIGGMSPTYLHDTMMAYKDGERPGKKFKSDDGEETDMNAVAKKLGEADIKALSDFYATKPFVRHQQKVDAALAAKGKHVFKQYCQKCHSEGGSEADDDASILAGQWKAYLKHEFELFTSGERVMSTKMAKRFKKVSEEEKATLIEFLAGGSN